MITAEEFDLVIRNGTVATASDYFQADVGIKDGVVAALGEKLGRARDEIDAAGLLVLPGGVDSHCHVEQVSSMGIMCADDFYSATVSAAFGGTTTIMPFAAQHKGQQLPDVVADYRRRAEPKAVIDYAFHLIISELTPQLLECDLPNLIRQGYTSFKVYMTYDMLKLDDFQLLQLFTLARRERAMTMLHAENNEMIRFLAQRLAAAGNTAPRFHAVSHTRLAESEAVYRALSLAELAETPLLIVHVSDSTAAETIRAAQTRGVSIYGETCPQYLFLTADDLDRPALEGAMFCCSPPPRDAASQQAMWQGIRNGTFQIVSSDHAPYTFDERGKLPKGDATTFREIANGVPGLEMRLPLLFTEGVVRGRIDINRFVAITATNHAKLYGLYPRKGTIAIGSDADIAIWDPSRRITVSANMIHDRAGYTPYEGRLLEGYPVKVLSRGELIVSDGELRAARGRGRLLPCERPIADQPDRISRAVPSGVGFRICEPAPGSGFPA